MQVAATLAASEGSGRPPIRVRSEKLREPPGLAAAEHEKIGHRGVDGRRPPTDDTIYLRCEGLERITVRVRGDRSGGLRRLNAAERAKIGHRGAAGRLAEGGVSDSLRDLA